MDSSLVACQLCLDSGWMIIVFGNQILIPAYDNHTIGKNQTYMPCECAAGQERITEVVIG